MQMPLNDAQMALWAFHKLAPQSPAYNMVYGAQLRADIDVDVLREAFARVLRSHEALHCGYRDDGGAAVMFEPQDIVPDFAVEQVERWNDAQLRAWLAAQADTPFVLERAQVCRFRLLRNDEQLFLAAAIHHIAGDFLSFELFCEQVFLAYEALCGGQAPQLPPPGLYREWLAAQRDALQGERGAAAQAFWREQLAGDSGPLALTTDFARPRGPSFDGDEIETWLSEDESARLRRLAQESGASLFAVLLALFQVFMHRCTGQHDFLVGTPMAGRSGAKYRDLIGYTLNAVPVRAHFDGDERWRDVVAVVQRRLRASLRHQHYPQARMLERCMVPRDGEAPVLFRHMVTLVPFGTRQALYRHVVHEFHATQRGSANDLNLRWQDDGRRLLAQWRFNTALFRRETVQRLTQGFHELVRCLLEQPDARIGELRVAPPEHLSSRIGPRGSTPDITALEVFERHALEHPHRAALLSGDEVMSYRALDVAATQWADRLRQAGLRPGGITALLLPRGVPLIVAMLAAWKNGAAYLCLDAALPARRLQQLREDSGAMVMVGHGAAPGWLADAHWIDVDTAAPAPPRPPLPPSLRRADLPAYVIYTSGSTGTPKAVVVTQGSLVHYVDGVMPRLGLPADATLTAVSSVAADLGYTALFGALLSGRTLRLIDDALASDPAALAEALARTPVDALKIVPSHLKALLAAPQPERLLPRQCLVLGGEGLDLAFVRRLRELRPRLRIVNHYGPTETTVGCVAQAVEDDVPTLSGFAPIGAPLAGCRVHVLDARLQPLPLGMAGELYVGGPGVAAGYLRRPGLTAERFVADPFGSTGARLYRTGDRVRMLASGAIEFLGRADHQVKIRGWRVELGEIEAWLKAQPELADAAVIAPAGPDGVRLVAYGVAPPGFDWSALRERMAATLPEHMLPSALVLLDRLPLTPNGKLDRKALPEPAIEAASASRAPCNAIERTLLAIWQQVLKHDDIGVEHRFFDLGGDSILALQIIARARAQGLRLTPKQLFELQSIEALARAIEPARDAALPPIMPARRDGPLPLSFAQQRLWFLHQMDPDAAHYNVAGTLRLTGALDAAALHGALQDLVQRHEILRTTFDAEHGEAVQRVTPALDITLPLHDLRTLAGDAQAQALQQLGREDAARPFDLSNGPLLRATLVRLGEQAHALLLTLHHIVCDGWSMNLLARELAGCYEARRSGRPHRLAPLAIQYADFAAWQRASAAAFEPQLAHWRRALGDEQPVLELPTDRARPARPSHRGARHAFVIDAPLASRLRALAAAHGASLPMLMLATFQLLLFRLSGQRDVRVGMPVANRARVETEPLVGCFVNTVVMRAQVEAAHGFDALLRQVREAMLAAQANQELPFERLVEALAPQRDLSRSPLFEVLFNMGKPDFGALQRMGGLSVDVAVRDNGTTQFDLMLDIDEEDALQCCWVYRSELWDATTIARWTGHLAQLLRALAEDPAQPVGNLPLLDTAEQAALLAASNPAPRAAHTEHTLDALFAQCARERPDAIALTLDDEVLSYGELDLRANRLAHRLRAAGVRPDMLVGLCAERSIPLLVGLLAILKAGGAYLPLDPHLPAERLAYMVDDADVRIVLAPPALHARLGAVVERATVLDPEALPDGPDHAPTTGVRPDHLAYVIYTSGSTGRPKGVPVTHRNVVRLFESTHEWFRFDRHDVWPLFHSFAFDVSVWEIFGALLHGGRLVVVPYWVSRSPRDFNALLFRERVTVLNQTPSAFRPLLQLREELGAEAPALALRQVIFAGEALDTGSLRPWFAQHGDALPRLVNMYGITETTVHVTYRPLAAQDAEQHGRSPIGEPIPDLGLYLLDAQMNPVPVGVPGELYVGGAGLARGYLKRPALTASRFVPDPFSPTPGARLYRSGDLARRLADGSLDYLGRIDHQVKLRGFRIELGEIEARLAAHPAVREATVLMREDRPGDPQLVAYVVVARGDAPPADALREHLRRELPEHMLPSAIVVLDAMPLTGNGKLDRRALPAPQRDATSGDVAPQTATEVALARIWSELLGVERVGTDADFFELGGHSLLAMRMMSRVRSELGRELPIRALFESPTIAQLAPRLDAARDHDARAIVPVERRPQMPLSFAQQRLWLADRLSGGSAAYNLAGALRLDGALDVAALRRAFEAVIGRHEVLCTGYPELDGEPVAVIAPNVVFELPCTDLSPLPTGERERQAQALIAADVQRPFELSKPPLLRAGLLKLAPQQHVLLLALHHLVADGWSIGVLVDEIVAAYRGQPLPALPVQVVDHAVWQRQMLRGERLDDELVFWTSRLAQAPQRPALPTDHPRPAVASLAGDAVRLELPPNLTVRLQRLANDSGASLFMVLLASFQLLVHRVSGQRDLVIGTDVAGRNRRELERLIGFFVNVLPLRSRLPDGGDFLAWLAQVRHDTLAALEHPELPFDRLVDALGVPRDRRWHPLVQVLFVLQNAPRGRFELPGLQVERLPAAQRQSKFDLALFVEEGGEGWAADWVYATALFKRETVQRWARAWLVLLEQVAADPCTPLDRLTAHNDKDTSMTSMSGKLDKLRQIASRASAAAAPRPTVRASFLAPGREFPIVVEPAAADLDPAAWALGQRGFIDTTLARHGAILFRGFGLRTAQDFEAFAEAMHPGLYGGYGDLPKKEGGRNTYRSTPYPERQMILFHNESSHLERWPRKQWFFCELPSRTGGATPIVDGREMLRRMPRELVAHFERKQLLYVRTFTRRLDVAWQDFFRTDDRGEVEARCRAAGIEHRWLPNDELQTRARCPAVITHPVSGERVFFNQVQLHHTACLDPEVREDLLATVGPDRLPRQVCFGDGSPIGDDVMATIGELYEECAVRFEWRQGDVLMLDNMLAAHARDPYEEPRKVVVAMADMFERLQLEDWK